MAMFQRQTSMLFRYRSLCSNIAVLSGKAYHYKPNTFGTQPSGQIQIRSFDSSTYSPVPLKVYHCTYYTDSPARQPNNKNSLLYLIILTPPLLFERFPFFQVRCPPQYGHLKGLPRAIFITSRYVGETLFIKFIVPLYISFTSSAAPAQSPASYNSA